MKTVFFKIACMFVAFAPFCSSAQTNVSKAFDNLLKNSDVEYTEKHSVEKDVDTGIKESQYDVYTFTLPAKKIGLIDNIVKAFKTDENKAYSFNSGEAGTGDPDITVAVGDANSGGVRVSYPGRKYIYAAFLAPKNENPSGNYRYVYAMNWLKDNDVIQGQLIITFATTLKYRQSRAYTTTLYTDLPNMTVYNGASATTVNGVITTTIPDIWFSTFMSYIQAIAKENQSTRQALAAKLYKHVQQAQSENISKEDKDVAREILKSMQSETKKYDEITRQLLNSALVSLK